MTPEQLKELESLMVLWYGRNHKMLKSEEKKAFLISHAMVETNLIATKVNQYNEHTQAAYQPRIKG